MKSCKNYVKENNNCIVDVCQHPKPKVRNIVSCSAKFEFGSTSALYFSHNAAVHIRASWLNDITSSSSCNNMVT